MSTITTFNAIDYFATLGKAPGPLECKSYPYELDEDTSLTAKEAWYEAITDIVLLGPGDHLLLPNPSHWTIIDKSLSDSPLEFPHLAFRRRRESRRPDHITSVKFIQPGELIPQQYELIRASFTGKTSGLIKNCGYLAFKRVTKNILYDDEPALYDVIVLKKNLKEEMLSNYYIIEKDSSNSSSSLSTSTTTSSNLTSTLLNINNNDVIFGARYLPTFGILNLKYKAVTLDRYPKYDYDEIEFPSEVLPIFSFPKDLKIILKNKNDYPLPIYYTFVFTDINGKHMYVSCLKFYEKLKEEDLVDVYDLTDDEDDEEKKVVNENNNDENNDVNEKKLIISKKNKKKLLQIDPSKSLFIPKVICLLSHAPFYRAMRRYLRQLYSLSLSSLLSPLHYFISSIVGSIPLPYEGGRPFHLVLDAALISLNSKPMPPIVLELPSSTSFPVMDLDFASPLRCLTVQTLLALFTLLLKESKIIFLSTSNSLLTETMEVLRMLLFPLKWSCTFISRLPSTLGGLLQAFGGFMIGIHLELMKEFEESGKKDDEMINDEANEEKKREKEKLFEKNLIKNYLFSSFLNEYSLTKDTYLVDLTSNIIYKYNGKNLESLSSNNLDNLIKFLPLQPRIRLITKLRNLCEEYSLGLSNNINNTTELDSAFDFVSITNDEEDEEFKDNKSKSSKKSKKNSKNLDNFPTLLLRDYFLSFMVDLLGKYYDYIIPLSDDLLSDSFRTFKEEFAVKEYLLDADNTCKDILSNLLETQMFSFLLQLKNTNNSYNKSILFFENASKLQFNLGLNVGGHGYHLLKNASNQPSVQASTATSLSSSLSTSYSSSMPLPAAVNSSSSSIPELPLPLYKLVELNEKWNSLNEVIKRQILQHFELIQNNESLLHLSEEKKGSVDLRESLRYDDKKGKNTSSYKLKMINLSTILSPIRNLGGSSVTNFNINYSNSFIQNKKLLHLLIYNDFLLSSSTSSPSNFSTSNSISCFSIARKEIETSHHLSLLSPSAPPLILPGPAFQNKIDCPKLESSDSYSYKEGWPSFTEEIYQKSSEMILKKVKKLRKERLYNIKKVHTNYKLFLRSNYEKLIMDSLIPINPSPSHSSSLTSLLSSTSSSSLRRSSMTSRPSITSSTTLRTSIGSNPSSTTVSSPPSLHHNLSSSLSASFDLISLSINSLLLRSMTGLKPINDLFQALGLIAQVESWTKESNLNLSFLQENIWRNLLICCKEIGGKLSRTISKLIYEYLTVVLEVKIDTLTSTEFSLSLASKKEKFETVKILFSSYFDQFSYLEELGFHWFLMKTSLNYEEIFIELEEEINEEKNLENDEKKTEEKKKITSKINLSSYSMNFLANHFSLKKSNRFLPFVLPVYEEEKFLFDDISSLSSPASSTSDFLDKVAEARNSSLEEALHNKSFATSSFYPVSLSLSAKKNTNNPSNSPFSFTSTSPSPSPATSSISFDKSPLNAMSKFGSSMLNAANIMKIGKGDKDKEKEHDSLSTSDSTSSISLTPPPATSSSSSNSPVQSAWSRLLGRGKDKEKEKEGGGGGGFKFNISSPKINLTKNFGLNSLMPSTSSTSSPLPPATSPTVSSAASMLSTPLHPSSNTSPAPAPQSEELSGLYTALDFDEDDGEGENEGEDSDASNQNSPVRKDTIEDINKALLDSSSSNSLSGTSLTENLTETEIITKESDEENDKVEEIENKVEEIDNLDGENEKKEEIESTTEEFDTKIESTETKIEEIEKKEEIDDNDDNDDNDEEKLLEEFETKQLELDSLNFNKNSIKNSQIIIKKSLTNIINKFQDKKEGITIHINSTCPSCSSLLLEEEILSQWMQIGSRSSNSSYTSSNSTSSSRARSRTSSMNSRKEEEDLNNKSEDEQTASSSSSSLESFEISCLSCSTKFIPLLTIHGNKLVEEDKKKNERNVIFKKKKLENSEDNVEDFDDLFEENDEIEKLKENKLEILWTEVVYFLNPFTLRNSIEDLMLILGDLITNESFFHLYSPALYWNLIYFTTRLHLPYAFSLSSSSFPLSPTSIEEELIERKRIRKEKRLERIKNGEDILEEDDDEDDEIEEKLLESLSKKERIKKINEGKNEKLNFSYTKNDFFSCLQFSTQYNLREYQLQNNLISSSSLHSSLSSSPFSSSSSLTSLSSSSKPPSLSPSTSFSSFSSSPVSIGSRLETSQYKLINLLSFDPKTQFKKIIKYDQEKDEKLCDKNDRLNKKLKIYNHLVLNFHYLLPMVSKNEIFYLLKFLLPLLKENNYNNNNVKKILIILSKFLTFFNQKLLNFNSFTKSLYILLLFFNHFYERFYDEILLFNSLTDIISLDTDNLSSSDATSDSSSTSLSLSSTTFNLSSLSSSSSYLYFNNHNKVNPFRYYSNNFTSDISKDFLLNKVLISSITNLTYENLSKEIKEEQLKHYNEFKEEYSQLLPFISSSDETSIDLFPELDLDLLLEICNDRHSNTCRAVFGFLL